MNFKVFLFLYASFIFMEEIMDDNKKLLKAVPRAESY
jgi:hypothetical protein